MVSYVCLLAVAAFGFGHFLGLLIGYFISLFNLLLNTITLVHHSLNLLSQLMLLQFTLITQANNEASASQFYGSLCLLHFARLLSPTNLARIHEYTVYFESPRMAEFLPWHSFC